MVGPFRSRGFTLLEVLVALVLLEVGLLGALGLLFVASRTLSRAVHVERAAAEAAAVADSLSRNGIRGAGEVARDGWRVSWESTADGLRVSATTVGAAEGQPLAVVFVP